MVSVDIGIDDLVDVWQFELKVHWTFGYMENSSMLRTLRNLFLVDLNFLFLLLCRVLSLVLWWLLVLMAWVS